MAQAKRRKAPRKAGSHYKDEAFRKEERIGVRVNATDKALLEAAAHALGIPLSEFILSAALAKARETAESDRRLS
jgi:uncharacterized protein (DUF1778 family)